MRRTAATRIVSRVVLPSRVLAVGLGVGVGVLVVVICTNRSVQRLPPVAHRVKYMGGPDMAPQTPQRSERPGERVALLDFAPTRGEGAVEERHGSAATLRAAPGSLGALRGASRLRRDASSHPGGLRGRPSRSVTAAPRRSEPPPGS